MGTPLTLVGIRRIFGCPWSNLEPMSSPCTQCGYDLSSAPLASSCPNCGAAQTSQSGPKGPPPRRGPPAPPPRRPGSSPEGDLNPFAAAERPPARPPAPRARDAGGGPLIGVPTPVATSVPDENPFFADPTPEPSAEVNPFLVGAPAPTSDPGAVSAPRSAPIAQQPEVAPLRVERGAVSPTIKDPHAEFRKGSWKKPAIFGVLGAGALVGLFYLVPQDPVDTQAQAGAEAETQGAVIGRTVAPEVIQDPNNPTLSAASAPEQKPQPVSADEPAPSPKRPDQSGNFADAFKSAAK